MSDTPRNITLERVNRLTQAVGDLAENNAAQNRMTARLLVQMNDGIASLTKEVHALAGEVRSLAAEQVLLGNRVEEAFARAMQANYRLNEIEDKSDV